MKKIARGFTIVELLIVIVIIAVLASITVAAYNGVTQRSNYSRMRTDMATIRKALELYKADNGRYPSSAACNDADSNYRYSWCGWNNGSGDSFIPGLSPKYLTKIPNVNSSQPYSDSYIYRSSDQTYGATDGGGTFYELVRYRSDGLSSVEKTNNPDAWTGNGYDGIAWGFKSVPSLPNW